MRARPLLALAASAALATSLACSSGGGGGGGNDGGDTQLFAPTGLTAAASTTAVQIALTWNAEAAATGGYEIWRAVAGGSAAQLTSTLSTGYLDQTVPAGTSATYTVRAVGASGESGDSSAVTALTIPAAPTDLAASSVSDTSITISWTEATGAEGGDEVSWVTGHGTPSNAGATGASFTATGLMPSTTYVFSVIARDATGQGPAAEASFTTLAAGQGENDGGPSDGGQGADGGHGSDAGPSDGGGDTDAGSSDAGAATGPGDAFDVTAFGSDSQIVLQWEDQGASSYQIFRSANGGAWAQIDSTSATTYADTGGGAHPMVINGNYSYYLVPLDETQTPGDPSSAAQATALGIAAKEADPLVDDVSATAVPADWSQGIVSAPLGLSFSLIPDLADGGQDTDFDDAIQGGGTSGGLGAFPGVPAGRGYTLYASPLNLYVRMPAGARAIDLSSAQPGRTGETANIGATLSFNLTGLDAWDPNDSLQAIGWGAQDFISPGEGLDALISSPPQTSSVQISGTVDSSDLFGADDQITASRGDALYLWQTELDDGGTPYTAARKGYGTTSLTMRQGQASTITGALSTSGAQTQRLSLRLAASNGNIGFLSWQGAVNPSASYGDPSSENPEGLLFLAAEPQFADYGAYGFVAVDQDDPPPQLPYGLTGMQLPLAPRLVSAPLPADNSDDVSFGAGGALSYVDPFPARWQLALSADLPFSAPLQVTGVGTVAVTGHLRTQGPLASYVSNGAATVTARISPVTSAKVGSRAANATGNPELLGFSAATPLIFSWAPPAFGTPTRYTVTLYSVDSGGVATIPTAVLITQGTQIALPPGLLTSGANYVAIITATAGDADRFGQGVLAYDGASDSADLVTSAFTVE